MADHHGSKDTVSTGATGKKGPPRAGFATKKGEVDSFEDLLQEFPMISRQMQPGLEKAWQLFIKALDEPLPEPLLSSSATTLNDDAPPSPTPDETTPMMDSAELRRTRSTGSTNLNSEQRHARDSLERLVVSAIDLFQSVDQQQRSLVAESTNLTGTNIESMIERYVTDRMHANTLWPKVRGWKQEEDQELDFHMKQAGDVDISQIGITDTDAFGGKYQLSRRVAESVTAFKKLGAASSPQEMLNVLLETQRCITQNAQTLDAGSDPSNEKQPPTSNMSADTLVSLLLMVVIRSPIRSLHARLMYIRDFNFLTDVESGYAGYALSTYEAVLTYLSSNSRGLRNISLTNRKLWHAVKKGDIPGVRALLDPTGTTDPDIEAMDLSALESIEDESSDGHQTQALANGHPKTRFSDDAAPLTASNLNHVFPFKTTDAHQIPPDRPTVKKRVSMHTRSASSSSINSIASDSSMLASVKSMISGETTAEQLSQTEDSEGKSILFMAVENDQARMLKYLLRLEHLLDPKHVMADRTSDDTNLLSMAVRQGNGKIIDVVLEYVVEHALDEKHLRDYLAAQDSSGRSVAHYCFGAPYLISSLGHLLPWRQKDKNGQTPLFAMCRSYDLGDYHDLAMSAITTAARQQGKHEPLELVDHVDNKGNTLLHIVTDNDIVAHLLFHCSADANALNDKRFTPLMVASKFARLDTMRVFFTDPRTDLQARDLRGLTAVEVAKDDDVRNRIDDMVLLLSNPCSNGRKTAIVRAVLVDDGTIRLVIKSGAPSGTGTITVTTSRRSLVDFDNLVYWLSLEQPASYVPQISQFRSPFQITPKPSKQVLRDTQLRLDGFLQTMLTHPSFAKHEMLWEFFLVPDIDPRMLAERARHRGEVRVENLPEDHPSPLTSPTEISEVEIFTGHAIDQLRHVQSGLKGSIRRLAAIRNTSNDLAEAHRLGFKRFSDVASFTPDTHLKALQTFAACLHEGEFSSSTRLLYELHTSLASTSALLGTLSTRSQTLINAISTHRQTIAQAPGGTSSSSRSKSSASLIGSLPQRFTSLNILDKPSSRDDVANKVDRAEQQMQYLGRELRYTQATVASELAGWQDVHAEELKEALKGFARRMVVGERNRLDCMQRARRGVVKLAEQRDMQADVDDMRRGRVRVP